ncbi:MAG: acyltransferase [Acidobacteriaceae bacterium]|nr:acyltransferase [Acidobacteriaceae bacterium]
MTSTLNNGPQAVATTSASLNLDVLRSCAVLLTVGFHLAKLFNAHAGALRTTDFGLLGVMLFFVHTTLVLMFSLQRQRSRSGENLFLPFMIRRIFRIYPLALVVVTAAYILRIPSDLHFGHFELLHQSPANLISNLLLVQNVTLQKANPGPLWSLPLEIQMYLVLPALFVFASRFKSALPLVFLWCCAVACWFGIGLVAGVLPLSEGGYRSPAEIALKFTRFAPCFLTGILAFKLWSNRRILPGFAWPIYLLACCTFFVLFPGSDPIETGWFICFAIALGSCCFRELKDTPVTKGCRELARYSYGVYLLQYFAMWTAFDISRHLPLVVQIGIFIVTLGALPVALYHWVEAPLIGVGVRLSEHVTRRSSARLKISVPQVTQVMPLSSDAKC